MISKFFEFDFESNAYVTLKNALLNHRVIAKELDELSLQAIATDKNDWLFIPTYQSKLKNYLSYSFEKGKITSIADKINFVRIKNLYSVQ